VWHFIIIECIDWQDAGKGDVVLAALDKEMDDYQKAAKAKPAST
jgi:hypothetical protein